MRILTSLPLLMLFCLPAFAQDVIFELANSQQTTSGGNTFYDVDILVSTSTDFQLGSGQLYFDYNPQAFGNSVNTNNQITVTTAGFILGQAAGFPIYSNFTTNDNSPTRVSFSWIQALSSSCYPNNVFTSATALFHLQLQYTAGGTAFDPGVCFTSAPPFDDQTFTACGPSSGACGFSDCGGNPGTRILNDAFDCINAPLPLDLVTFDVKKDQQQNALARWQTVNEVNTSHFEIERSIDTKTWTNIGQTAAAGYSQGEQQYRFYDKTLSSLASLTNEVYYRLKMIDQDGAFSYSVIRSLSLQRQQRMTLYPNPTVNSIYLQTDATSFKGQMDLQLLNTSGKNVWAQTIDFSSDEAYLLEFGAELVPGVYLLRGKDQAGNEFNEQIVIMKK